MVTEHSTPLRIRTARPPASLPLCLSPPLLFTSSPLLCSALLFVWKDPDRRSGDRSEIRPSVETGGTPVQEKDVANKISKKKEEGAIKKIVTSDACVSQIQHFTQHNATQANSGSEGDSEHGSGLGIRTSYLKPLGPCFEGGSRWSMVDFVEDKHLRLRLT